MCTEGNTPGSHLPRPSSAWLDAVLALSLGAATGSVLSLVLVVVGVIG